MISVTSYLERRENESRAFKTSKCLLHDQFKAEINFLQPTTFLTYGNILVKQETNERLNRNYGQRELMQQQGQTGKDTVKRMDKNTEGHSHFSVPPLLIFCSPTIS